MGAPASRQEILSTTRNALFRKTRSGNSISARRTNYWTRLAGSVEPTASAHVSSDRSPAAVGSPEVSRLLRENPTLATLVKEAADQLGRYIPDAHLSLQLLADPDDGDDEQLFLGVSTSLQEDEALEALRRFDQEWWVHNARRAGGLLCIDLSAE